MAWPGLLDDCCISFHWLRGADGPAFNRRPRIVVDLGCLQELVGWGSDFFCYFRVLHCCNDRLDAPSAKCLGGALFLAKVSKDFPALLVHVVNLVYRQFRIRAPLAYWNSRKQRRLSHAEALVAQLVAGIRQLDADGRMAP